MGEIDFSRRSTADELMDSAITEFAEFDDCLRQLEFINVCTIAYRPTLQWVRRVARQTTAATLLDVGSGGGDMLRRIASSAAGGTLTLTGIDINPWSKRSAEQHDAAKTVNKIVNKTIHYETRDIFTLDADTQFDFIISALFTHHLPDALLVRFLQWMERHATQGWFINDLHRHPIAYYFIKLATKLFSRNRLIRHDAAVSVARSFTRQDWQNLLSAAGVPLDAVTVTWHFPFRYSVARRK